MRPAAADAARYGMAPAEFGQVEAIDLAVDAYGSLQEGVLDLPPLGCFLARIV